MTPKRFLQGTALSFFMTLLFLACKKEPIEPNRSLLVANAGTARSITLPQDSVHLDGSASVSTDGTITSYKWAKSSGPPQFSITDPDAAKTAVTGLGEGLYTFQLTVMDNKGATARSTVVITVLSSNTCNSAPFSVISGPAEMKDLGFLPLPRTTNATVAIADKLLIAGGYIQDNQNIISSDRVDIYHFTTKQWSVAQLKKKDDYQVITVGNKVLFAANTGGIEIYDAVTNTWSMTAPDPRLAGVYYQEIAVLGNKVFFAGGFNNDFPVSVVNIYDVAANTWSLAALSEARAGMATAVVGNKVVFAGGYQIVNWFDVEDPSKKIDIYDATTNSWSTAELPQPVLYGTAAAAGSKAVFHFEGLNNVTIYDAATNAWTTAPLSVPRTNATAMAVGGKILLAGGYIPNGTSSRVDIYDPASGQWSVADMGQPGHVNWFVVTGNRLLVSLWNNSPGAVGGVVEAYDVSSQAFKSARLSHQVYIKPVAANNKWYFGGVPLVTQGATALPSCKVWELDIK